MSVLRALVNKSKEVVFFYKMLL